MVQIITRGGWTRTPRPDSLLAPLNASEVRGVAVHWTGGPALGSSPTLAQSVHRLEAYRRLHVTAEPAGRGWSDIAYSAAVDQSGRVFDARGIDVRSAANGDQPANRSHGAVLFLIGQDDHPTVSAVEAFRAWRRAVWLRRWPAATGVVGHRDLHATECPGAPLYRLVSSGQLSEGPAPLEDPMGLDQADVDRIADAVADRLFAAAGNPQVKRPAKYVATTPDGRKLPVTEALTEILARVAKP
jgi:hypothetical protein